MVWLHLRTGRQEGPALCVHQTLAMCQDQCSQGASNDHCCPDWPEGSDCRHRPLGMAYFCHLGQAANAQIPKVR